MGRKRRRAEAQGSAAGGGDRPRAELPQSGSQGGRRQAKGHVTECFTEELARGLRSGADVLVDGCMPETDEGILRVVCEHLLAHVLRRRKLVLKHNRKLRQQRAKSRVARLSRAQKIVSLNQEEQGDEEEEHVDEEEDEEDEDVAAAATAAAAAAAADDDDDDDDDEDDEDDEDDDKEDNTSEDDRGERGLTGEAEETSKDDEEDKRRRDQGFVRPKALLLVPTRGTAVRVVRQLAVLLEPAGVVRESKLKEKRKRKHSEAVDASTVLGAAKFEEQFGASVLTARSHPPGTAGEERDATTDSMPEDWRQIFGDNADDDFRLGIAMTPGQGLRLFTEFFSSDILLASPLGLIFAMQGQQDAKKRNFDVLSSLELVFVHQAYAQFMQNGEHILTLFENMNMLPKETHNTDFSRVRQYFLNGQAAEHRQTIISTRVVTPDVIHVHRGLCRNAVGRQRVHAGDTTAGGSICQVATQQVQQVFQRVRCNSPVEQSEARFRHFVTHVLPKLLHDDEDEEKNDDDDGDDDGPRRVNEAADNGHCGSDVQNESEYNGKSRVLIVTPSYFDYIRVRNELIRRKASAVFMCEYSRTSEKNRARSWFYQGRRSIMLYSGRLHYFSRYHIRGAHHVVFYSLPDIPEFYPEIVNVLEESAAKNAVALGEPSCWSLFTKFDKLALQRIVGAERAQRMLDKRASSMFLFSA